MPNVDRLESLADVQNLKGEFDFIAKGLTGIKDLIGEVGQIESVLKGATKFSDVAKATEQLNSAMKQNEQLTKQLADAQDKLAKATEQLASKKRDDTDASKQQAQATAASSNSQKDLLAQSAKLQLEIKKLSDTKKELNKDLKNGKVTEEEYKTRLEDITSAQLQLSTANTEVSKTLKAIEKDSQQAADSISKAKSQIALLAQVRDKLSIANPDDKKTIDEINQKINEQNKIIEANVSDLEKRKINIGNYQGSAKIIVDALEKARQKVEQVSSTFGPLTPEAMAARKEFEALDRITANPRFLNIAANVGDTNKELKFFTQQLNALEDAGLKNSQIYSDIRQRLAHLTDQLGDTRAEIKALSSDTRTFDLLAGSVKFLASTWQTAAGAMELFGGENEDVQKSIQKLVAIQSIAQGVQQIGTELTTKGSAAYVAYSYVQNLVAVSTDKSAAATLRLAAASKLLLGGAIIGAIAFLVIKFIELKNATSEAAHQAELLSDINKEIAKSAGEEISKLQTLYAVATNNNLALKDRKRAVDELQKDYPDYFKNIKDEIILQGKAADAYDKARESILENAKTRAIEGKLAELATKELQIQFDQEERLRQKFDARVQDARNKNKDKNRLPGTPSLVSPEDLIAGQLAIDALNDQLADGNKELEQIAKDREFLLKQITKPDLKIDSKAEDDAAKKRKEAADKELQTQFNILKVGLQQQADFNKQIVDDEKATIEDRLTALQKYLYAREKLINGQAELERKLGKKTASELKLISEQQADELLRLSREIVDESNKILKNGIKSGLALRDDEKKHIDQLADDLIKGFKDRADKELEITKKLLEQKKELKKQEKDLYKNLYSELEGLAIDFVTAQTDREIARNEDESARIDERRQKDIDNINQTVADKKQAADQIAVVDTKANADKIVIENKNRELERKKQKIERDGKIADIVGTTTQGVVSLNVKAAEARAQAALLAANPLTAALAPLALAQSALIESQVPLIIGLGAAQVARLLIPRFADGTDDAPGGLSFVGDGGKAEGILTPDGKLYKTPARDTLVDLPKGSMVFPDFSKIALKASLNEVPEFIEATRNDQTAEVMMKVGRDIVDAVKNMPQPIFKGEGSWQKHMKDGSNFRKYLDHNL